MSKLRYYPTKYELMEVLSSITNKSFLNKFAQERGIFITNSKHNELANEISDLFLDDGDLELIRRQAYQENAKHTLSGFIVDSDEQEFNLKIVYQKLFDNRKGKMGQILTAPRKLYPDKEIYQAAIEYNRKKPGRIEFLQDEFSYFEFTMQEISKGKWKVEVDCNRSTDTKELKELLETGLSRNSDFITINPNLLSNLLSVDFFDNLAKQGLNSDWEFRTVRNLTLKKGNDEESHKEESEVLEVRESTEEMAGITHAILSGQNLRNDTFVTNCVDNGYRFGAMSYEYHNKIRPEIIQIKAEFKARPIVFEVSVSNFEVTSGAGATRIPKTLSSSTDREIRSEFWNNAKQVYNDLIRAKNKAATL